MAREHSNLSAQLLRLARNKQFGMWQVEIPLFAETEYQMCWSDYAKSQAGLTLCRFFSRHGSYVPSYHYGINTITVEPTKSDNDIMFCLQLLSKILTCTLHLT